MSFPSHACSSRLLDRALQLPPGGWLRLATYNCGLSHFQIRNSGSVSMFGFGDIGHLDLDKTTYH